MIATLHPDYFQAEINKAYKARKERKMLQDNKYIEFGPNMLNLIQNCSHVATGGKCPMAFTRLCRPQEPRPPAAEQGFEETWRRELRAE